LNLYPHKIELQKGASDEEVLRALEQAALVDEMRKTLKPVFQA
jgi:LSU ribosomal protein L14E